MTTSDSWRWIWAGLKLAAGGVALVWLTGLFAVEAEQARDFSLDGDGAQSRSFAVSEPTEIVVRNRTDGRTVVRAVNGATEVRVRTIAEGRGAEDLEVDVDQCGRRIRVDVRRPGRRWFGWRHRPARLHIEIEAPRRSDIDARNDDGDLLLSGVL